MRQMHLRLAGIGSAWLLAGIVGLAFWWTVCWPAADAYFAHRTDVGWHNEVAKAEQWVATTADGFERRGWHAIAVRLVSFQSTARRAFIEVHLLANDETDSR